MKKSMKKIIAAALMAAMMASMAGCSKKTDTVMTEAMTTAQTETRSQEEILHTPGTYTSERQGNSGLISATVEFNETEILSVIIGENKETAGLANLVLTRILKGIVVGQTLNVDAASGATITSEVVSAAVADCMAQASGDVEALKGKEAAAKTAGEDIEGTADAVVIGGGGAGLTAAVSAFANGTNIILTEKGPALGGNALRAGGAYNAVGEVRQAAVDMDDSQITELKGVLELDEKEVVEEYRETSKTLRGQTTEYLAGDTSKLFDTAELHTYQTCKGGARTGLDGMEIHGNFDLVNTLTTQSLDVLEWLVSGDGETEITDNIGTVLGGLWPRMYSLSTSMGHGFISPLEKEYKKNGVEIMMDTAGKKLIAEDGRVTGVEAEQTDGTKMTLHAGNGVVTATGGYGANPSMTMEYGNYWGALTEDMPTTNTALVAGDGIVMGREAGANLASMGYAQLMSNSHPEIGSLSGGLWGSVEEQVFVNKEGKRSVSEYESRDVLAKAVLEQTDGILYIICGQESTGNPQRDGQNSWGNDTGSLIANGSVLTPDTLEGPAEQIGRDADVLATEIEKYNSYCESGVDEDLQKMKLGGKIDVGPFWATPREPSIHHTMGGLEISTDAQALDVGGNAVPGLYAAGEVTGGIHAGSHAGGNVFPDIIVFDRTAGQSAAAGK